jgi:glycosyltransferase involved in cell wall biosynthesis
VVTAHGFTVGVVVPARDEAGTIGATLRSVRRALDIAGVTRSTIVVVADDCHDRTAEVARTNLRDDDLVVEHQGRCVGAARQAGSAAAMSLLGTEPDRTFLLFTDADTTPGPCWVARHLAHAASGVECVAGTVALDPGAPSALRAAFERAYHVGVDERTHPHVHGANLGIRADTLSRAGGWPQLRTGEDHALWHAVGRLGRPRVQDPLIEVLTSARTTGRAPEGFARDLQRLALDPSQGATSGVDGRPGSAPETAGPLVGSANP